MVLIGCYSDVGLTYPGVGKNTNGCPVLALKSSLAELR